MESIGTSLEFIGCVKSNDHLDIVGTVYEGDMYLVTATDDLVAWSDDYRGWLKVGTFTNPGLREMVGGNFLLKTSG
jgi:hypothetical protein